MPFRSMPWGGARATQIEMGGMAVSFWKRPGSIFCSSALYARKVQHQIDDPIQRQPENHRKQDAEDDEVARLAMGEVAGAVFSALHAEGRRSHAVEHLPEGGRLIFAWFVHDALHTQGRMWRA